jgi:hypothetical protein
MYGGFVYRFAFIVSRLSFRVYRSFIVSRLSFWVYRQGLSTGFIVWVYCLRW